MQTGNARAPVYTLVRPPGWQEAWEPAPAFRLDTGPCLRYFGSVLAGRPVQALQGVFTLGVTLGQVSAFLLSARRRGWLFYLPKCVRRHIRELGIEAIAERTGLSRELEALLAVHDAVKWSAVLTLPPFQVPQAGVLPMPRHSLRVHRASRCEYDYRGWTSTEVVADLGIPVVLPDTLQVSAPWFGAPHSSGATRRHRE